mgnify:CR=1 FL=1
MDHDEDLIIQFVIKLAHVSKIIKRATTRLTPELALMIKQTKTKRSRNFGILKSTNLQLASRIFQKLIVLKFHIVLFTKVNCKVLRICSSVEHFIT